MDGDPFDGADFEFLAANVTLAVTGETIFPPYAVRDYRGIRVAFIGVAVANMPSNRRPFSLLRFCGASCRARGFPVPGTCGSRVRRRPASPRGRARPLTGRLPCCQGDA